MLPDLSNLPTAGLLPPEKISPISPMGPIGPISPPLSQPSTLNPQPPLPPVPNDPDQPFHLPNGQALYYTLGVETLMRQIFRDESTHVFDIRDSGPIETMTFLWICAHNIPAPSGLPRLYRPWRAMGPSVDGSQLPLYLRPFDLADTVMDWVDAQFPGIELLGFQVLALTLWNHHHGAEIIIDPGYTSGAEPEKKNLNSPTPTPSTLWCICSQEGTPPNAKPFSGICPCGKPSQAATATSSPSDSPVSPLPTTTGDSAPPPTG